MSNVRPIRPDLPMSPAGQAVNVGAVSEALADAQSSARIWRIVAIVTGGIATYQWYQHSYRTGNSIIRRYLEMRT